MSLRTKKTYIYRIRNFIRFHNYKHPTVMGADEVIATLAILLRAETWPSILSV